MFSGPIRSGNRGGTGLFKWDDVKDDKHRENYLGHSINAPVGRWQKGKDLGWYAKNKDGETVDSHVKHDEIADIKQKEADAMAEALGLKAKKVTKSTVSPAEIQRMLKLDAAANEEFNPEEGDKKGGLGFGRIDTATFKSRNQNAASDSESNHGEEPKMRTDAEKRQRNSDDESEPDKAEKRSKPKKEKKERKEKKEKKSKKEKRDRKEKKSKRHHTE
ncbi:hypothetical protein HDU78_006119 [Chytriomyces hyalinus]|nr:hypothetical protein HDU78_006119 [Chytriomyces hyalinus]